MFQILYRVTEDIQYIKSLDQELFDRESDFEGFFALNVDGHNYGYYHHNPLQNNETGCELITNWFTLLLKACIELKSSKYVAVSDIESYNTWIEFVIQNGSVLVSIIEAQKEDGSSSIQTKPFEYFNYGEWNNIPVGLSKFQNELMLKASQYFKEIVDINPKLMKSKRLTELENLIENVKKGSRQQNANSVR